MKIRNFLLVFVSVVAVFAMMTEPVHATKAKSKVKKKGHLSQYSKPDTKHSRDPADIVDTLGIRLGMTYAQAQEAAKKRGAVLPDPSPYDELAPNHQKIHKKGPNPDLFGMGIHIGRHGPDYNGPNYNQNFRIYVYPKDITKDYRDLNNLIVFFVEGGTNQLPAKENAGKTSGRFVENISHEDFIQKAKVKFPNLMDSLSIPNVNQNMAHCHNAVSELRSNVFFRKMAMIRAGSKKTTMTLASEDVQSSWRKCGEVLNVMVHAQKGRGAHTVRVFRYDFNLSEEAFRNLSQVVGYTSDHEQAVQSER